MPLHVAKYQRFQSADRNALGLAALEFCRAARAADGVNNSRYFWIDPNEIAILTEADPGAWGNGSASQPSPRAAAAVFALAMERPELTMGEVLEEVRRRREGPKDPTTGKSLQG